MTTELSTETPDAEAEMVVRAYLDALVTGDVTAIAASFAEDARWSLHGTLPLAGTKCGRKAIMEFLLNAANLYRPGTQSFTFTQITAQGDRVAVEWRVRGIATATGIGYDNDYCGVFTVHRGRIVEVREYLDSLHAAHVLFAPDTGSAPDECRGVPPSQASPEGTDTSHR